MAAGPRKSRKQAAKPAVAPKKRPAPARPVSLEAQLATLKQERDQLAADLQAAKARIATLEAAREEVLNRIEWVIDSLHTVRDA